MSEATTSPDLAGSVRRNILVLAAGMAALYAMVELVFGVAGATFEELGGSDSLAGLAPALFLLSAGLAALPAGRAMDRSSSRAVLAAGFLAGAAGCLLAGIGATSGSLAPAMVGFALTGVATGTILLSRAAAAGMVPPERRPRAIGQVLFGAVFGALLGPLVFGPLIGDGEGSAALDLAWFGGAGFMLAGLLAVIRLDPDPRAIAQLVAGADDSAGPDPGVTAPSRPLTRIIAGPGIAPALLAVLASWAGMVTAMSLVGTALVDHGHDHGAVFPVLAAHFAGMFGFFIVVGPMIERLGRIRAIAVGLALMAASGVAVAASLAEVHFAALALFGVGLGWSLSFVAATAELSERVPDGERATVIGFADLLGDVCGALLVVGGGIALEAAGEIALALGAAALPALAALWVLRLPAPALR